MAWTREEIQRKHPVLYHVTFPGNRKSVEEMGLLSTFGIHSHAGVSKTLGLRTEPTKVPFGDKLLWLNDQIPMANKQFENCKKPLGMSCQGWFDYLDQHVFFWASKKRLTTFLVSREKRNQSKNFCGRYESGVFRVNTSRLFDLYGELFTSPCKTPVRLIADGQKGISSQCRNWEAWKLIRIGTVVKGGSR